MRQPKVQNGSKECVAVRSTTESAHGLFDPVVLGWQSLYAKQCFDKVQRPLTVWMGAAKAGDYYD